MSFFTGYVTREENDRSDSENDSDPGSDDDLIESDEFDLLPKSSRKLRSVVEIMKEMALENGRFVEKPGITRVRGRFDFLFSQPWWMVKVKINGGIRRKRSKAGFVASVVQLPNGRWCGRGRVVSFSNGRVRSALSACQIAITIYQGKQPKTHIKGSDGELEEICRFQ